MKNLSDAKSINGILKKHNFKFTHSLGQNFINNLEICAKIAKLSGANQDSGVIEIGPGAGALTRELAKFAKKVVAVEIDKRLIPVLEEIFTDVENVKILEGDILKIDLNKLISEEFHGVRDVIVCANLPYYITSPVIMKLLDRSLPVKSITLMLQKEVAQRICAAVGQRASGSITVATNYNSKPEYLFTVNKNNFIPVPKVDSAVIKLSLCDRYSSLVQNEKAFFKIVKLAFLHRRKILLNSLSSGLKIEKEKIRDILEKMGLDENLRAENLSMEQFVDLSNLICGFADENRLSI